MVIFVIPLPCLAAPLLVRAGLEQWSRARNSSSSKYKGNGGGDCQTALCATSPLLLCSALCFSQSGAASSMLLLRAHIQVKQLFKSTSAAHEAENKVVLELWYGLFWLFSLDCLHFICCSLTAQEGEMNHLWTKGSYLGWDMPWSLAKMLQSFVPNEREAWRNLYSSCGWNVGNSRNKLLQQIFGLQLNDIKDGDERRWMEKHFHPVNLTQLCTKMKTHMQNLLMNDFNNNTNGGECGLFSLCYSLLFRSGYLTLFGSESNASAVYKEFREFDDRLTKLARKSLKHDSVLSETLRLTAAVMINRDVVQDKSLRTADGRQYLLRKGDKVCLFPFLSPQMNPDIHTQPQMFKYDRFLNGNMTAKKTFYKDGRQLEHYSMPWGAGGNMCVGKDFAVFTIKQFVFLVLTHLDLELCDPAATVPPVDPSRFGFGMLQPLGDLQVRCRLRTTQH
ncbi:hypothetical protein WMY93_012328 [Mugilogobius chulae]|uniref:Prostacyclin synthase n=1 Tax=Mugilogobius chulae TaxID=88201 RepID=A0AAW0PDZ6_9GOBI